MNKQLKPCPYRIHGERTASLTVAGEFYYNETFMPCIGKKCICYLEGTTDAFCFRDGKYARLTEEEVTG